MRDDLQWVSVKLKRHDVRSQEEIFDEKGEPWLRGLKQLSSNIIKIKIKA